MPTRHRLLAATASALLTPLVVVPLTGAAPAAGAASGPMASEVAVDWQRTAVRTIFTEAGSSPAVGQLYLAFTSLAVHDAAVEGQRHGTHTATAAVAVAAHDVLSEYFPGSSDALDADLAASLEPVPDGPKEDLGSAVGAAAAERMITSRVGDGRGDASIVYAKDPAPGVWQPAPGGSMAVPWLGFVDPVVDVAPVAVDGPDALPSAEYARDYGEVLAVGATTSTTRTPAQTAVAQFFSPNVVPIYRSALCDVLHEEPLGLLPTTRLFARIDAASATALIQTWRLKYEVGFWRPSQAIAGADLDGNPATTPQDGWSPLVPNPPYSDYTSGHAAVTAPFAEVVRRTLGDHTPLVLQVGATQRSYATLSALEYDAFHARIWGGLHFRDAMEDGYHLGHVTAARVMQAVR